MARLLTLGWRDIWRNRRRSLLTMGAIVFAMLVVALIKSSNDGTYDAMEERIARQYTGDLQVYRGGFFEDRALEQSITEQELDVSTLRQQNDWITATARRLDGFGLVSSDSASAGALITGVDPASELELGSYMTHVSEGIFLADEDHGQALLGRVMAQNLSVGVGDSIVVLTQGYHSVMGAEIYVVKGLVGSGSGELDRSAMILTLPAAQELLSMPGRYTSLIIQTDNHRRADHRARSLALDGYEAKSWRAIMTDLVQLRNLDNAGNFVIYAFLFLLVGLEIFNTTTMSMLERVREFGVMMAIGLNPGQISVLIILQVLMKVLLAVVAGGVLIAVVTGIWSHYPIPLPAEIQEFNAELGFAVDGVYFSSQPSILLLPVVSVLIMSAVSLIYPVVRVRRLTPVAALGSN
ncbi:MAG: ABC transporter permease [Bacteroidota bacterium]|nr:ABC transporter permease [Bacteroidota bacterium]